MLEKIIDDSDFSLMMQRHIADFIVHFFEKEQHFGVLCKVEDASFQPELPDDIAKSFNPLTLFFLAGYTFESANIQEDHLIFEAGFGADNFGSVVSVPLINILQIIVEETPVMINLATNTKPRETQKDVDSKGVENSMSSFLSNPENSKFLK